MKLLTPDRFRQRHAELVELRQKADANYRRANLESAMGSDTEADVLKAKQALDLIVGQLDGLEAARVESERIQAIETREARQAAHAKLVEDAEQLLAEREGTIARIEAMARDLGQEISAYAALTAQLGSAVSKYRPHYQPKGIVAHLVTSRWKAASDSTQRNALLLPLVVATIEGNQRVLEGSSLVDREAAETRKVRNAVGCIAQQREMA